MSEHRHVHDLLPALANGSISSKDRARVLAHLMGCGPCQHQATIWTQIRDALADDSAPPPDEQVLRGVWAMIDEDGASPFPNLTGSRRVMIRRARRSVSAAAASLLLVLVVLATAPWRAPQPEELLLVAAVHLTEAGSGTFGISGEARMHLDEPLAGHQTIALTIVGAGAVRFDEAVQVQLTVTAPADLGVPGLSDTTIERVVREGRVWVREGGGVWERRSGPPGPVGAALLDPSFPVRLLRAAEGPVKDLGLARTELGPLRHLRFAASPDAVPQPTGVQLAHTVDVWIDEDGRLRRVRVDSEGRTSIPLAGRWSIEFTAAWDKLGGPVRIADPSAGLDR